MGIILNCWKPWCYVGRIMFIQLMKSISWFSIHVLVIWDIFVINKRYNRYNFNWDCIDGEWIELIFYLFWFSRYINTHHEKHVKLGLDRIDF